MARPRVLICSPRPEAQAETFVQNHIRHLPFEILVAHGDYLPYLIDGKEIRKEHSLVSRWQGRRDRSQSSYSFHRRASFRQILREKRIDYVLGEYILSGAAVADICKEEGIPFMATGLGYELAVYEVLRKNEIAYRNYLDKAHHTVLVARPMIDTLVKLGGNPERMTWSPAGPASSFFDIRPDRGSQRFFALGRFVEKKAPHLLIAIWAKLKEQYPQAQLVLGGDGPLLKVCQEMVKGLGLEDQVKFLGRIDQEEQRSQLAQSLAFIQHSRTAEDGDREGTPVAILEAMAVGLPIISTEHSGIPFIVEHETTGLLSEENDTETMLRHVVEILENSQKVQEMGEKAREIVRSRFSLAQHIDTLTRIIESGIAE